MTMLFLHRVVSGVHGVFGMFYSHHGEPLCVSLEPPALENRVGLSCIPKGEYKCVKYSTALLS